MRIAPMGRAEAWFDTREMVSASADAATSTERAVPRYIGEILLNIDDQHMSEAEDWIKKAIDADSRNGTMFSLGKDYSLYAESSKRKGDLSRARENLNTAAGIYKECGADGWLKKAEEALAKI